MGRSNARQGIVRNLPRAQPQSPAIFAHSIHIIKYGRSGKGVSLLRKLSGRKADHRQERLRKSDSRAVCRQRRAAHPRAVRRSRARVGHGAVGARTNCAGHALRQGGVCTALQSGRRGAFPSRRKIFALASRLPRRIFAAGQPLGRFFAVEGQRQRGRLQRQFRCGVGYRRAQYPNARPRKLYRVVSVFGTRNAGAARFYARIPSRRDGQLPHEGTGDLLGIRSERQSACAR